MKLKKNELDNMCSDLIKYSNSIVSLDDVMSNISINSVSIFDRIFFLVWKNLLNLKDYLVS